MHSTRVTKGHQRLLSDLERGGGCDSTLTVQPSYNQEVSATALVKLIDIYHSVLSLLDICETNLWTSSGGTATSIRYRSLECVGQYHSLPTHVRCALNRFPRRSRSTALQMASELTKTAISYMRVKELREELASRGLDTDGVRPVLLARLREGKTKYSRS